MSKHTADNQSKPTELSEQQLDKVVGGTKKIDKASAKLFESCATGEHIKGATVVCGVCGTCQCGKCPRLNGRSGYGWDQLTGFLPRIVLTFDLAMPHPNGLVRARRVSSGKSSRVGPLLNPSKMIDRTLSENPRS
jgi:hypothetical protein